MAGARWSFANERVHVVFRELKKKKEPLYLVYIKKIFPFEAFEMGRRDKTMALLTACKEEFPFPIPTVDLKPVPELQFTY